MQHIEDKHQAALFSWAARYPMLDSSDTVKGSRLSDYLFAVPNGGRRKVREAARMKRQGVKAGVTDIILPLARGGYAGFVGELKKPVKDFPCKADALRNLKDHQRDWLARMALARQYAVVSYGWDGMKAQLEQYLALPWTGDVGSKPMMFLIICPTGLFDPDFQHRSIERLRYA